MNAGWNEERFWGGTIRKWKSGLATANCRCSLRRPNSMILQARFQSLASKTASSLISLDLLEVYIQNEKNMPQTKLLNQIPMWDFHNHWGLYPTDSRFEWMLAVNPLPSIELGF